MRSEWVEGERVFGPPQGTYDADWVASAALDDGAGPPDVVRRLAGAAWPALRADPAADEAALARALRAVEPGVPPGAADAVARAALAWCRAYDLLG